MGQKEVVLIMPWIKITIIATLVSSIVFSGMSYLHGKKVGANEASIACSIELESQYKALQEANEEIKKHVALQRDSYRIALDVRNTEYEKVNNKLTEKQKQLQELINESNNACVTATIPDAFK